MKQTEELEVFSDNEVEVSNDGMEIHIMNKFQDDKVHISYDEDDTSSKRGFKLATFSLKGLYSQNLELHFII